MSTPEDISDSNSEIPDVRNGVYYPKRVGDKGIVEDSNGPGWERREVVYPSGNCVSVINDHKKGTWTMTNGSMCH